MSGPPIGALDSATVGSDGAIAVKGWAIDPDVVDPIRVDVYVDAVGKALTANTSRTDIAAAHPPYGDKHGFDDTFSASPGVHQVCAYGIDVRPGGNVLLGCKSVTVPGSAPLPDLGRPPFGNVEAIDPVTGGVSVAGWALDPDTASPIHVDVYVDSSGVRYTADGSRSDVAAAYPAYGAGHGFSQTIAASAGAHRVCAYAINNGAGGNVLLGCKSVTVQ
jgi:hypothetical protein